MRRQIGSGSGWGIVVLGAVWACGGPPQTTPPPDVSPTGTTGDTAVMSTGSTADTAPPDTGTPQGEIDGLTWSLHPDYPTVVYAQWGQGFDGPVTVEYSFDPDVWHHTPTIEGLRGDNEAILVGIPYSQTVQWRVVAETVSRDAEVPIVTPDPPTDMPLPTLVESDPSSFAADQNYLLVSFSEDPRGWGPPGRYYVGIFDRQARPVWIRTGPADLWTLYPQVSVSGTHILYDQFSQFSQTPVAVAFRSYLDQVFDEIEIPGHHHAFIELPDGTLAWGDKRNGEKLMERAPGAKDPVEVWSCAGDWPQAGNCISNALFYRPSDDTYVYSFYTLETVVAIDRSSGSTLWWAGKSVPGGYAFDPPESQFWWQHGVNWTADGHLLVSTHDADNSPTTNFGREYEVDHTLRQLRRVWQYDADAYASTNGDIRRLANGHTLHSVGSSGQLKEVDAAGGVVWHLDFQDNRMLGRAQLIDDLYDLVSTYQPAVETPAR